MYSEKPLAFVELAHGKKLQSAMLIIIIKQGSVVARAGFMAYEVAERDMNKRRQSFRGLANK